MTALYETFVKPYEQDYYLIGAIIALVGLLGIIFEESISLGFLIGILLFFLSLLFFNLTLKIMISSLKSKKLNIWTLFFQILFFVFVFAFFSASYSKYQKPFEISIALFCAFFLFGIVALLRGYFVIFQKGVKRKCFKVLLRIIFLFFIIVFWAIISFWVISGFDIYSFGEKISSNGGILLVSSSEWFYYTFLLFNNLFFFIAFLVSIVDIFKKEPMGHRNLIWNKSRLYKIIEWFKNGMLKNWWKNFYLNNLD